MKYTNETNFVDESLSVSPGNPICILMDFPIHFDTISMGLPILYLKGFLIIVSLSLKVVLILANSADPDEMQHYAAFHLGLTCLAMYPFRSFQYTLG